MNSTIMVQKSVKDLAAKKAKKDGLSLSTVTRFLLQGYSEGKLNISLTVRDDVEVTEVHHVSLDKETQDRLDFSVSKWRNKLTEK